MSDFSRRTVVRGAAWTVPVVAVASQAPAFAVSPPPYVPPTIDFTTSCANTGTLSKGCGFEKTLQVPLTVTNPSLTDSIVFQITSMFTCNGCATAPTSAAEGYSGVSGIFLTTGHSSSEQSVCNTAVASTCPGGIASVVVPANTTLRYWIVSAVTGSSDSFQATINYRLLTATCTEIFKTTAKTTKAISPANCK